MAGQRYLSTLLPALLTMVSGVALPDWSHAEGAGPAVSIGEHVRVTGASLSPKRLEGDLAAQKEEVLRIAAKAGGATVEVPRAQVTKLEVARVKRPHWLGGALAGVAGGLVLGAAACSALPCQGSGAQTESLAMTAFLGTAAGLAVGWLIRTDHWTTVPAGAVRAVLTNRQVVECGCPCD